MKIELDVRGYAGPNVSINPNSIVWPDKVLTFTGPHAPLRAGYGEALTQIHKTRRWTATRTKITPDGVVIYRVPRVAFWRKPPGWSADIRRDPYNKLRLVGICAIPRMKAQSGPSGLG